MHKNWYVMHKNWYWYAHYTIAFRKNNYYFLHWYFDREIDFSVFFTPVKIVKNWVDQIFQYKIWLYNIISFILMWEKLEVFSASACRKVFLNNNFRIENPFYSILTWQADSLECHTVWQLRTTGKNIYCEWMT